MQKKINFVLFLILLLQYSTMQAMNQTSIDVGLCVERVRKIVGEYRVPQYTEIELEEEDLLVSQRTVCCMDKDKLRIDKSVYKFPCNVPLAQKRKDMLFTASFLERFSESITNNGTVGKYETMWSKYCQLKANELSGRKDYIEKNFPSAIATNEKKVTDYQRNARWWSNVCRCLGVLTAGSGMATATLSQSQAHAQHTVKAGVATGALALLTGVAYWLSGNNEKKVLPLQKEIEKTRVGLESNLEEIAQEQKDWQSAGQEAGEIVRTVEHVATALIPNPEQEQERDALINTMLTIKTYGDAPHMCSFIQYNGIRMIAWDLYINGAEL